ncbi:MAG: hypothetical protein AB8U22_06620 [Rickettsia aeschlimannii]
MTWNKKLSFLYISLYEEYLLIFKPFADSSNIFIDFAFNSFSCSIL